MGFGSAGESESTPHQRGDWASPFDNSENNRRRTLNEQAQRRREAGAKEPTLERRNRGGNGRAQSFLGDMALTLDGVRIDQVSRFE